MASNFQRGTVKLDASDWTRIKKLNGARGNMYVVYGPVSPAPPPLLTGITNPATLPNAVIDSRRITEFGTSKIRRPASIYTDYLASQTVDYPTQTTLNNTVTVTINRLCNCTTSSYTKQGLCSACMSNSITKVKG
ncbi:MAG: hypothetical protein EB127_04265 [Alphaproteobacteria bacterium]|nr:hypothetical protein [Alphaproteobacteria bacterium]